MIRMSRFFLVLLFVLFWANSFYLTSAQAADDETLLLVWFDDPKGDSTVKDYDGWSYATGVSLGISNDCFPSDSSDTCSSYFEKLTIEKYASTDSADLAQKCAGRKTLGEVKIVQLRSAGGGEMQLIWEIDLETVKISRIGSGINNTDGRLMEAIEINTNKIKWIFYKYDSKGNPLDPEETTWDIVGDNVF